MIAPGLTGGSGGWRGPEGKVGLLLVPILLRTEMSAKMIAHAIILSCLFIFKK